MFIKHRIPVDALHKHDTRDDIPYIFFVMRPPPPAARRPPQKCIDNKDLHTLTAYTYYLSSSYVSSFPPHCRSRLLLACKNILSYIFYLMI